jgi:hypothetical protein
VGLTDVAHARAQSLEERRRGPNVIDLTTKRERP